jgi:PAS domain-containing protein
MNKEDLDFTDARMLRSIAEEQLKENQQKTDIPPVEFEVKKLVHELQVHQIELEMQNEELRHAYETAEAALKKYTMLYDFAPTGYFTLDHDGRICELNFSGAEMLGDKRFSLINSNFKLFVSDQSKPDFNLFFKNLYSSYAKEACELFLSYDNNPLCAIYVEGIVTGDNKECLLSAIDITSYKKQHNF